ncbi:hypothetical protein SNE40_003976 [Patella caerulea]|uniref:Uncharacterized protein n=1 Tax=Patella caerulea TaxID=87958 RepID=A0AAN8KFD8_PATCE
MKIFIPVVLIAVAICHDLQAVESPIEDGNGGTSLQNTQQKDKVDINQDVGTKSDKKIVHFLKMNEGNLRLLHKRSPGRSRERYGHRYDPGRSRERYGYRYGGVRRGSYYGRNRHHAGRYRTNTRGYYPRGRSYGGRSRGGRSRSRERYDWSSDANYYQRDGLLEDNDIESNGGMNRSCRCPFRRNDGKVNEDNSDSDEDDDDSDDEDDDDSDEYRSAWERVFSTHPCCQ